MPIIYPKRVFRGRERLKAFGGQCLHSGCSESALICTKRRCNRPWQFGTEVCPHCGHSTARYMVRCPDHLHVCGYCEQDHRGLECPYRYVDNGRPDRLTDEQAQWVFQHFTRNVEQETWVGWQRTRSVVKGYGEQEKPTLAILRKYLRMLDLAVAQQPIAVGLAVQQYIDTAKAPLTLTQKDCLILICVASRQMWNDPDIEPKLQHTLQTYRNALSEKIKAGMRASGKPIGRPRKKK